MPLFRSEIAGLTPYVVGRPIEDVAREIGLEPDAIIKLTANESPEGPFPGVSEAVAGAISGSNRYPDNDVWDLGHALARDLEVQRESLLFGAGSTALISEIVSATGGPGTNIVYGWPSFIMYRFAAVWAGAAHREVPLDQNHELDLRSMAEVVDDDTRVVVVCNPNNPTGTITAGDDVEEFVEQMPADVLVVVDEAYHEFVQDDRYRTAIPLATTRPNVVVLRTFSKIYSLAGFRVGYAVGMPETLGEIRKAQAPLTVSRVSQAAAQASIGQSDELERRIAANAAGRHHLHGAMAERDVEFVESHTNFIYFKMPGDDSQAISDDFTKRGVILRPMVGGWLRVTVGSEAENQRFISALDEINRASPA